MSPLKWKKVRVLALVLALSYIAIVSLPLLLSFKAEHDRKAALARLTQEFPVTVDPARKLIVEDTAVNEYLLGEHSPLQAAAVNIASIFSEVFEGVAAAISQTALYSPIAAVEGRLVSIPAGFRKEQVAAAFGKALGWKPAEVQRFLSATASSTELTALSEGHFSPGVYALGSGTTPEAARALVEQRFAEEVLARYSSKVSDAVPLKDALIIASLIQREAAGPSDMRIVSGIIWNRLFADMRLQIDASVQYARANRAPTGAWWPAARPADMSIKSPYNTYRQAGLPPGPIANPSVAAVVAALNPVSTTCLFYFHDRQGEFHCSDTYQGHVALLKKYYGRGK